MIELPLLVGLLLIPFGLLILMLPTWVQRQTAARDGAAEAARVVALGGSIADAADVVAEIEAGYGLTSGSMSLELAGEPTPGRSVVARVTIDMPVVAIPVFGSLGGAAWTTEHVERYPDYGRQVGTP